MSENPRNYKEVRLDDLISFKLRPSQMYQGERLEQLMNSIEKNGLIDAIIVRPVDGEQYEIICGHNRVNAMRKLGRDTILAEVRDGLSNDEALGLFYDTNLNQQSFHDRNYAQKIKAVQYTEGLITENAQQGKRFDLKDDSPEGGTCVQNGHKSKKKPRRLTTRDRMAHRLGIATATLSKYRSIVKLPEELIDVLARMLDARQITFEVAYILSRFYDKKDVKVLLTFIDKHSDRKVDLSKLKELCANRKDPGEGNILPELGRDNMKEILVPVEPASLPPITYNSSLT